MVPDPWFQFARIQNDEDKEADRMTRTITARLSMALLSAGLFLAQPQAAPAQTYGISALVNGEPITSYELKNRARFIQLTQRKSKAASRKTALQDLVDERLKLQEAKKRGLQIGDQEVNQAIGQRAGGNYKAIFNQFRRAGVDPATLQDLVRANMLWGQMVRGKFRAQVKVRDQDILAAIPQKKDGKKNQTVQEYTLQRIIFVVPAKASRAQRAVRQREASNFRNSFTSCKDIVAKTAKLRNVSVKKLGRRNDGELPAAIQKELSSTPVGKLTRPKQAQSGVEMIAVCDKREIKGSAAIIAANENEVMNSELQIFARRYIRDLRQDAVIEYRNR